MKHILRYVIVAVLVLLFGCKRTNEGKNIESHFVVEISNVEDNFFSYEGFIDSIQYIQLETLEENLIGTIDKIKIINDTIYIGDFRNTKSIFAFSINGKFLFKISCHGKGKGEFIYLNSFEVIDNRILIYDEKLRKLLTFTKNGEFISEIRLSGFLGTHFATVGINQLAFYKKDIKSNVDKEHELLICDTNGEILKRHFKFDSCIEMFQLRRFPFSYSGCNTYFIPTSENCIYKLENSSYRAFLEVNFKSLALDCDYLKNLYQNDKNVFEIRRRDFANILNFVSSDKFAILSFSYKEYIYYSLIEYPNYVHQTGNFINRTSQTDFLAYVPICSYNNKFVSVIESFHIQKIAEGTRLNQNIYNTNLYNQIGETLFHLKGNENPFIVLYSLKAKNLK